MRAAMPSLETVRVWSRSAEKRETFARNFGVQAVATAEEAVRGADILVTATNYADPILDAAWVAPGTHINAMGSNQARRRELPADLVRRADLIAADSVEQSRMESGDLLMALADGDWGRVVELKDVATGRAGRTNPSEVTIFKSNGLAAEDVAAAGHVYERARETGAGRTI